MKKLISLVIAIAISLYAGAKVKISMDKSMDSVRVIQTERTPHIFPYKGTATDCAISLTCLKKLNTDDVLYMLRIYIFNGDTRISKGNKLLLKLDNSEVIVSAATDDFYPEESSSTQNIFGAILSKTYIVAPNYVISNDDLSKILTHNVEKVRVETYDSQFDGEVYGKKFSKTISECYSVISEALKENKSVYDNF